MRFNGKSRQVLISAHAKHLCGIKTAIPSKSRWSNCTVDVFISARTWNVYNCSTTQAFIARQTSNIFISVATTRYQDWFARKFSCWAFLLEKCNNHSTEKETKKIFKSSMNLRMAILVCSYLTAFYKSAGKSKCTSLFGWCLIYLDLGVKIFVLKWTMVLSWLWQRNWSEQTLLACYWGLPTVQGLKENCLSCVKELHLHCKTEMWF